MASATKKASLELIAPPAIEKRILVFRGRQVILDEDLADLYGVETRVLVQQMRRNEKRFPPRLHVPAVRAGSGGHGGRRKPPLVFTEQGIAMLSGVLRSERAIAMNIKIMRVFVELRRVASSYTAIEKRLEEIERKLSGHDQQLSEIFMALRQLRLPVARASGPAPRPPRPRRVSPSG